MKTAVEFLEKGMEESGLLLDHKWLVDLIEQAKAMEKEQIIEAYNNGDNRSAELYYKETFKSE